MNGPADERAQTVKSKSRQFDRFCQRGDLAALGAVFDHFAPRLLHVALHLVGEPSDAEDLLQETFVVAIERADEFDPRLALEPWLGGILRNLARNALRRRAAHRAETLVDLADSGTTAASAEVDREELRRLLRTHLDRLPAEQREVLALQLDRDLAPAEIAAEIGLSPGAVRMRLQRAREQLRRYLPPGLAMTGVFGLPARGLAAVRADLLVVAPALRSALPSVLRGAPSRSPIPWLAPLSLVMTKKLVLAGIAALAIVLLVGQLRDPAPPTPLAGDDGAAHSEPRTSQSAAVGDAAPEPGRASVDSQGVQQAAFGLRVRARARLTDGSTRPLAGLAIHAWPGEARHAPLDEPFERGLTDSHGQLTFTLAQKSGQPTGWSVRAPALVDEPPQFVAGGADSVVEFEIVAAQLVRGLVVDADGAPVADATLVAAKRKIGLDLSHRHRLERVDPDVARVRTLGRTDAVGRFEVPVLADDVRLAAYVAGFAASRSVRIGDQTRDEVVLRLGRPQQPVRGVVLDPDGAPAAAAVVLAQPGTDEFRMQSGELLGPRMIQAVRTNDDGEFCFDAPPLGAMRLTAMQDPHLHAWQEINWPPAAGAPADESVITLQLGACATAVGTITWSDGTPAAGLGVRVKPSAESNSHWSDGYTRADGGYALPFVQRRSFAVEVGRGLAVATVDDHAMGVVRHDFVIPVGGRIDVSVVGPDARGVPDYKVSVRSLDLPVSGTGRRSAVQTRTTDPTGVAVFRSLEGEQFEVSARGPHVPSDAPAVVQRTGLGAVTLHLPVEFLPEASLVGRVVDSLGRPVAAAVKLKSTSDRVWWRGRETRSGEDGLFTFEGLGPGAYSLTIDGRSESVPVEVRAGQANELGDVPVPAFGRLRVALRHRDGRPWRAAPPTLIATDAAGDRRVWQGMASETATGVQLVDFEVRGGAGVLVARGRDLECEPVEYEVSAGATLDLDLHLRVGRDRTLRFNRVEGDRDVKSGAPLTIELRRLPGGELLEVVADHGATWWVGGYGYWSLNRLLDVGRYSVIGREGERRYALEFEVTDEPDAERVVDVPRSER